MQPPSPPRHPHEVGRGLLGKRRDFLVSRRFQLRAALLGASAVLVLLVLLNVALYLATTTGTNRLLDQAPYLEETLRGRDRLQTLLVAAASAFFLAGVFAVGILETHRTAGAEINLARRIRNVARGTLGAPVSLRRGDNLRDLAAAIDEMTERLRDSAERQAQQLEELARRAETAGAEPLAGDLRKLAGERRHGAD